MEGTGASAAFSLGGRVDLLGRIELSENIVKLDETIFHLRDHYFVDSLAWPERVS